MSTNIPNQPVAGNENEADGAEPRRQIGRSQAFGRAAINPFDKIVADLLAETKAKVRGARVAAHIKPRKIDWLWENWLPKGVLSLLFGMPKCGKGLLLADIAARVTHGADMPDGTPGRKGRVLWVESEDLPDATLVPRFIAAGADLEQIEIWDQTLKPLDYNQLAIDLQKASDQFELIVLSALKDTMPTVEKRREGEIEIRAALASIAGVAQMNNCAIIGICHTNKKTELSGLDKLSGSGAYVQYARQIIFACLENADEKDGPRRLSHTGGNLGQDAADMLFQPAAKGDSVAITWKAAPYSQTNAELFGKRGARDDGKEGWLIECLAGGPKLKTGVIAEAKARGYSERTIERVFGKAQEKGLCVSTAGGFGKDRGATWALAVYPRSGGGDGGDGGDVN